MTSRLDSPRLPFAAPSARPERRSRSTAAAARPGVSATSSSNLQTSARTSSAGSTKHWRCCATTSSESHRHDAPGTGASSSTAGARARGSAAGTSVVAGLTSSRSAIAFTPPSPRSRGPPSSSAEPTCGRSVIASPWGELDARDIPVVKHLPALLAAVRPVSGVAPQLIHGDLTGNVLFGDGLAPAIIDLSPYWRPPRVRLGGRGRRRARLGGSGRTAAARL